MKRVMMEIGLLFVGLSMAALHTLVCYKLFGLVVTRLRRLHRQVVHI